MVEAAFLCDLVRVRELLAEGADPNVRDQEGRAPLHQAVLGNSVGLVGLLLESKADVNAADEHGWTPLHFAARNTCQLLRASCWPREPMRTHATTRAARSVARGFLSRRSIRPHPSLARKRRARRSGELRGRNPRHWRNDWA